MNNHDVISDSAFTALLAQQKRKEKLEHIGICILAVALFAVACSPVFFQAYFSLFF